MRRAIVPTAIVVVGLLLVACTSKVIEKVVKETVIVEGTPQVVEKVVKETVVVEAAEPAPPSGPVTLRFTTFGTQNEYDTWDDIIRMFEEKNPNIRVIQEPIAWTNLTEKMIASALGGNAADVMRVGLFHAPRMHMLGIYLPLDDLINGPDGIDLDIYFKPGLEAYKWNGVQYAFPQASYCTALFYNIDLFQEAGMDAPNKDWTWDDLKLAAQKLTIKDDKGEVSQYGFAQGTWNSATWIYAAGGWFYDPLFTKVLWDSPEGIAAGKFMQEMVWEVNAQPALGLLSSLGGEENLFAQQKAAIGAWVSGPVGTLFKQTEDLNYAVTWLPPMEQGKFGTFASPDGYAITADTKHPREAWLFLKYLISPEVQTLWYERLGAHKPNNSVSWNELGDKLWKDPHAIGFLDMMPYSHTEAWQDPNGDQIYWNIWIREAVQRILAEESEGANVEEVWTAATKRANEAQAQFWKDNADLVPHNPAR